MIQKQELLQKAESTALSDWEEEAEVGKFPVIVDGYDF